MSWKRVLVFVLLHLAAGAATAAPDDVAAFPAPLPGWKAGEVAVTESREDLLGMPVLRHRLLREYKATDGGAGLAIMIDSFDCIATTVIDSLHGDATFRDQNRTTMRPVTVKGHNAMEGFGADGKRDMVSVKVSSCGMVSVGGPNTPPAALDAYLNLLDLERIGRIGQ